MRPSVAQRANTVFTMLPSSPQVNDVYLGNRGILQGITHSGEPVDSLFVDSTTLGAYVPRPTPL